MADDTSTAGAATDTALDGLPKVSDVLGPAGSRVDTVPMGGGLTAHVLEAPARFSRTVHNRIYDALIPVTTQSFAADMTPYWEQRSKEGYLERLSEFVLVEGPGGAMVGWTGCHVLPYDDVTLVYLDSTGMVPLHQSRGVMRALMRERITAAVLPSCPPELPVYLTARSESPVFYRLMRNLLGSGTLFPDSSTPPPPDVVHCVQLLARWLGQSDLLNLETLALQNAYHNLTALYGELPTTGDSALDTLFREQLGPLDAYLLAGQVR